MPIQTKRPVNPSRIETHIDTFILLITKVVHKHAVFNLDFVNHGNFEKYKADCKCCFALKI